MAVSAIDYILQLTLNVRLAGDSEPLDSSPIIMLFFIGVFPAVFEELIYRGVLYRYLRRHGEVFAAIVSSLFFGLVHMNFVQLVFAASMGFVLCRLYEATGKLRYGMLIHFLNNSIMVISYYLPVSETMNIMIQIVLGVIAIIGLSIFVFRKRKAACLETISSCKSFFVAVPMILLTVICLGFCVMMVNS
ncbi:MAG: lysostaphin resistance A-like protein [Oscillospiraceae bacterium]